MNNFQFAGFEVVFLSILNSRSCMPGLLASWYVWRSALSGFVLKSDVGGTGTVGQQARNVKSLVQRDLTTDI